MNNASHFRECFEIITQSEFERLIRLNAESVAKALSDSPLSFRSWIDATVGYVRGVSVVKGWDCYDLVLELQKMLIK